MVATTAKHTEAKFHQLVAVLLMPIGVRQNYEPRSCKIRCCLANQERGHLAGHG